MGNAQSQTKAANKSKAAENREQTSNLSWPALAAPRSSTEDTFDNLNKDPIVEEDEGSEDEKESYQSWLNSPPCSERDKASLDSQRPFPAPTSLMSNPSSHDAPSSSEWLGNRPSTDTPLHPSVDHHVQDGKRFSISLAPRGRDSRLSGSSIGGESTTTVSAGASARSSFALERASLEANHHSLEAFHGAYQAQPIQPLPQTSAPGQQAFAELEEAENPVNLDMLVTMAGLPPDLRDHYAALCVLPPQTPAPTALLEILWRSKSQDDVIRVLKALATSGVVNIARLPTGHVWALPLEQHLQFLQVACKDTAADYHARLVDAYAAKGHQDAAVPLSSVPDDGYFLANIGYHLIGAGRLDTAQALLFDPIFLERKLKACSAAAVVADFRRYLLVRPERGIKLVLEAFQMSVGLVQSYPQVPGLLRSLIVGRLLTAPLPPNMQTWLKQQKTAVATDGAATTAAGQPRPLPPLTASLDQAGGLQRLTLKGHRGAVNKLLLTPSGTEAVSGGADGTARVWDLEIGDCTIVAEGHTGPITDMGITADGSLLITASEDGTARAHELERGQCLRILAGHEGRINAIALDPYGRFVLTAGSDGTVRAWDLASARALHVLPAPQGACAVALSPCTRWVLVGCGDGSVRVFDVLSGQPIGAMQGHTRSVSAVAFTPDSKRAVSASHDGTVRVWSLRTGRCTAVMEGHSGRINALTLSSDGKIAVTAGDEGTACVWDVNTGACRRVLKGHNAWVSDVALCSSNERLVTTSADGTAMAWALDTGEVIRVLEGHSGPVLSASLTRRGRFAVTASEDGSVRVWDFTATTNHTPKWHEGRIRALTACDGMVVATAGDDCVARLWDSSLGDYRGLVKGHSVPIRWAQFSEDGSRLVTASPDRRVCVWDATTLELLYQLPVHKGSRMKSFAASGDLSSAVVCLFDSTVTIWDLVTGEPTVPLQKWGERDESKGHTSAVNEVLMSADGATVVTFSKDSTARVWDVATGTCAHVLRGHTDTLIGGCMSDDGRVVATHSYDNTVRLWSLDGGPALMTIALPSNVTKMALARCGSRLAAALVDGSIVLCDFKQSAAERRLQRVGSHTDEVTGLSFGADGSLLTTCSLDGSVQLMDASTGRVMGMFVSNCGVTCCHYDSVTDCIVVGSDRGVVHFLDAALHN